MTCCGRLAVAETAPPQEVVADARQLSKRPRITDFFEDLWLWDQHLWLWGRSS